MMDLFDAITSRASSGRLVEPGPSSAQLEKLLAAASRAPDHGRMKPWRFAVINGAARESFATAVAEARRARLPDMTDDQIVAEKDKVRRSPTIVVVGCAVTKGNSKVPEIEQVVAVGAAVENMLLAANAMGLGVMWKTGPAAYDAGVKAAVGLGPDDHIVAILHLGTRAK
jgi:nitroreductase